MLRPRLDAARRDADARCQKCLQSGHWTYDCTRERVYRPRPSRTAMLAGAYAQLGACLPGPDVVAGNIGEGQLPIAAVAEPDARELTESSGGETGSGETGSGSDADANAPGEGGDYSSLFDSDATDEVIESASDLSSASDDSDSAVLSELDSCSSCGSDSHCSEDETPSKRTRLDANGTSTRCPPAASPSPRR